MVRKILLMAAFTALAGTAAADFRTLAAAYEVPLSELRLPVSVNGSIGMPECNTCASKLLRVTAVTQYRVNGESLNLNEFRRVLLALRDRDSRAVIVKHDLESDTATMVSISIRDDD